MNTYKKYAPKVFVANCEEEYEKGDVIELETKYGKVHECIVHNYLGKYGDSFLYSITRADGYNSQKHAAEKSEKIKGYADNAQKRSDNLREASNEGRDFLALAEPIKIGHHSEKRHRALIDRNWNRFSKAMEELKKVSGYENRAAYWERLSNEINLSMPESLSMYTSMLEEATEHHQQMKDGVIPRGHSFALTYAKKRVNDLKKRLDIATKLWA